MRAFLEGMEKPDGDELIDPKAARKWGFWYWKIIGDGKSVYMRRLNILLTPWFSIKLHFIYRPDNQRDLHDHPWSFLSLLLWGSYVEDVPVYRPNDSQCLCSDCTTSIEPRHVRWWNWKRAEDQHSIIWVSNQPIVTLVFCGPIRRTWGFWTPDGWVRHDRYDVQA